MDRSKDRWLALLTGLILATATAAVYWPVIHHDFINCDDQSYVYENPALQAGLSWQGVVWAFTTGYAGNWHPVYASALSAILFISGLLLAWLISSRLLWFLVGYAVITISYSLLLKSFPIVDVFCISSGFLIRLLAGGEVFQIPISPWLFMTVFLLAVFLSTGKRLSELRSLGDKAVEHRASLASYPPGFLDGTMYVSGSAVLVTYAMYSLNRHTLIYSVPLCLFGLLRYMLRVSSGKGGDPTDSLLKDRLLFMVGAVWVLMVYVSIYR